MSMYDVNFQLKIGGWVDADYNKEKLEEILATSVLFNTAMQLDKKGDTSIKNFAFSINNLHGLSIEKR